MTPITGKPIAATSVEFLNKVWNRLTDPSALIQASEQRRRARLLSAILVFLIPLGIIGTVVIPLATIPNYPLLKDPFFPAVAGGETLMVICYILSRTRHHTVGATLLILTVTATIFFGVRDAPDPLPLIMYLGLNTLLATLLMPLRPTMLVGLISVASVLLLPLLRPGDVNLSVVSETNAFTFVLIMSILTIVAANLRDRDLKRIEEQSQELAFAVRQAESANVTKRDFLATMSHELRTPLNAIIGFTEVMLMGLTGELPTRAKHTTERIHLNSERLLKLIDDILDISKIEAGRVDVMQKPFEMGQLVTNIQTSLLPQAAKKGLSLVTKLDDKLPKRIVGDSQRVEQIILNLGSNAIKFTDQGSVDISLKRLSDAEWGIVVSDTGIGIPPHAKDLIFEKFRQIDGSSRRAYGGSGLGLAISRELALLMDGTIKVDSDFGVGSTFTVTLPLREVDGVRTLS